MNLDEAVLSLLVMGITAIAALLRSWLSCRAFFADVLLQVLPKLPCGFQSNASLYISFPLA
jgi:hypothetical protein